MLQCAFLRAFLGAFLGAFLDAVSSAFWCGSVRMGAYRYVWVRMGALGYMMKNSVLLRFPTSLLRGRGCV